MFLNVTLLAGIAGALVPLVLHLLSRSRYRTVEWGAMMFLDGGEARVMRAARLRELVILLMRMGLIAGLATALAQPVVRGRWGGLARGDGRVNAVIVLDYSASMQFDENGRTRMDAARSAVLNILESLRENSAAVVLMGGREPEQLAQPTTDLQQLAQRVLGLNEPSGQANLGNALLRAADILDASAEPNRELYLVTDRQALNWRDVEGEAFAAAWRARLERGAARTRFFVIPVGSEKGENLAIESVEPVNPPAIAGQVAEVEVRVRNFGQQFRGNVELSVGDKSANVSVGAGATTSVRVPLRFTSPGSKTTTASLAGGGLKFDDRMKAALEVVEPIRVLIVSGDERGLPLQNESDFLRIALAPRAAQARQEGKAGERDASAGDSCRVDVEAADRWDAERLRSYQVVVLANVPQLSAQQAVALEQFVYEGGGLWVAPGNLTRVENYNATLYREGAGVLPARLLAATAEDGSGSTTLQGVTDFDHPIFRFLKGRPDPIPPTTIGRYFPAEVRGRDARVLAQYASGRPFLVEAPAGRGRVLLATTPLDADWGTLPLSNFYLPLVQSSVRHLAASLVAERNVRVGQPIVARFGPGVNVTKAEVRLPSGETRALPATRGEVRFARTDVPGDYRIEVDGTMPKSARFVQFVVRTPPGESDLTPLAPERWDELGRGLGFERVEPGRQLVAAAVAASRGGRDLWLTIVGIVIALGVAELAVVRRWTAGGGGDA